MTTVLAIILLIVFGIVLILLEFFVVPGVTIAGIGGVLLLGGSVYLAYDLYGAPIGHYFLIAILLLSAIMLYYALRSDTWKRLSLKAEITGKTNTHDEDLFHAGDTGFALTRLGPIGMVEVNGSSIEAKSIGPLIDEETEIVVVKVKKNQLIVKPK
jgi:membrane-bound ClpP family serine protease